MSKTPKETELDDIVRIMRTSLKLRGLCKNYSKHIENGNKVKGSKIKKWMIPAIIPSALLYNGKGHRNVVGLTNLCYIDIDRIEEKQIRKTMDLLRRDEHVVLALRSMSGKGLHFLIKYEFEGMEQPTVDSMSWRMMAKTYKSVFNTISNFYSNILNLSIDESGKNVVQSCNISYDPDLYYNPDAVPYTLIYEKKAKSYDTTDAAMHIMNSPETMEAIAKGIDDIRKGRYFTLDEREGVEDYMLKSLSIGDTSNMMAIAEVYIIQGRLSEAEHLLKYCIRVLFSLKPIGDKDKNLLLANETIINNLGRKIAIVKQLSSSTSEEQDAFLEKADKTKEEKDICQAFINFGKLQTINYLLLEADDDLSNDRIEANDKLVLARRILNQLQCPYKRKLQKVFSPRFVERENKVMLLLSEKRERDYKETILYIIDRFEALKDSFDSGNTNDCISILESINLKLKKLPKDANTALLREQYKLWYDHLHQEE